MHSQKALPGWAVFDGNKLKNIRIKGPESYEDYKGVLINNLIFYVPKIKLPKFLGSINTLIQRFHVHLPIAIENFHNQLKHLRFDVRNVSIHRNGWRLVLRGAITLTDDNIEDVEGTLKRAPRRIIKKALKKAKYQTNNLILKLLPLGYAKISIYSKDYRIRKLENYGLGSDLIGTIQIKRIKRIKIPDIGGASIEKVGPFRFAWNRAWRNLKN